MLAMDVFAVSVQRQTGGPCKTDHQDRVQPEFPAQQKCGGKNQHAFIVDEVVAVHENQCGGGNQSYGDRAKAGKGGRNIAVLPEPDKENRNQQDQNKRRQGNGKCRQNGSPDVPRYGIAYISRAVDADRPGRHLGNRDNIGEFGQRQPVVFVHDFMLDQGQHGISAAESENADLGIGIKELPIEGQRFLLLLRILFFSHPV